MNAKTILLVDDDADLLDVIGRRCRQLGLNVEHARNLLTANCAIEKRRPDLICVDVNMPTGNGLQFCESLSSDPATAGIPIIVLSGQQTPEPVDVCRRLGIPFVAKGPNAWERLEPLFQQALIEGQPLRAAPVAGVRTHPRPTPSIPLPPEGSDESTVPHTSELASQSSKITSLQIVVADDDRDLVHFLTQRFASLGCSVMGVTNAVDAINVIHRIAPHLVVLDVNMPDGNGLSVCEMMATDDRLRTTPVIVLTGRSDESTIRRCHDMLVFYVQKGAQIWDRIEPLVRELLRLPEPEAAWVEPPTADELTMVAPAKSLANYQNELMDAVFAMLSPEGDASGTLHQAPAADDSPPWVLCIDDDADFSDAIKVRLEQHGVAVVRAFSGMEGYRMAFTSPAAAIVLDYVMPNGQGDYVLDRLKSNPVTKDIPVFVVTGTQDKVLERRMRAMGAAGYLQKPVDFDELRAQMSAYIDILAAQSTTPFAAAHP